MGGKRNGSGLSGHDNGRATRA